VALPLIPLAQHAGHGGTGNGELIMTIFLVTVLVVIWLTLGVVCWIFWRAKKREDEAKLRENIEWSAPSS
jgi:heme/copper-type cytochrome/quinol oxidase subunit 2